MSFWDKLKSLFTSAPAHGPGALASMPSAELENRLRTALLTRLAQNGQFTAADLAQELSSGAGVDGRDVATVANAIERLYEQQFFSSFPYTKTWLPPPRSVFQYHPLAQSVAPSATKPAPLATPATSRAPSPSPSPSPSLSASGGPYRAPQNPFATRGLLGLSPSELRRRALQINPYRTAWIGRTDAIPPQSDERTALIDRGLILRGLLTEQQIAEIHQVGDLWIKFSGHWHQRAKQIAAATTLAHKSADEAVLEQRRQRAAVKAEKKRAAQEREVRRQAAIAKRRAEDIVFLGRGVSAGLADRRTHVEALARAGLPLLATPADVARALAISVPTLRWLCFHDEALQRTHYVYFTVPKRSGGSRLLSAPHDKLATAQAWVLREILARLPTESPAHGFVPGRSTVTNAAPHLAHDVVVNLDLSDFFPSITFARVRGVFRRIGYSPAVATVLALLCTECPRQHVQYDGTSYWVATGERALPQGACTSPALSNQVVRKLDRRLQGMAQKYGWTYTRYADDLTLSAPAGKRGDLPMVLARVRHVVEAEGFALNPKKGRVQRAAGRQTVTGIVVNTQLGLPREEVRRLRAILHGAKRTGLEAQNREGRPHFEQWLRGKIAYLAMVDRDKGTAMLRELDALAV